MTKEEYVCEFGGTARFWNPEFSGMYDGEGNLLLCRCGKRAGAGAFGKEAFVVWCSDCGPFDEQTIRQEL